MTQLEKVVECQNYLKGFFRQVIEEVEATLPQHLEEISFKSSKPILEKLSIKVNDECMNVRVSFSKTARGYGQVRRIEILSENGRFISVPTYYSIKASIKFIE